MGFALKEWFNKGVEELKKIKPGKVIAGALKDSVSNALSGLERTAAQAGGGVTQTISEVRAASKSAQMLPWIVGGGVLLIAAVLYFRRR